jgi:hypothetical protein
MWEFGLTPIAGTVKSIAYAHRYTVTAFLGSLTTLTSLPATVSKHVKNLDTSTREN